MVFTHNHGLNGAVRVGKPVRQFAYPPAKTLYMVAQASPAFSAVFAAYPELSPMRDLLDMMMQSVSVYLWFYILEASLLLLKCAGLIWFAASARRTAFLATAIVAGLLCILTFVTAGLAQALLNAAGVVILYVLLRKQWHTLRK